MKVERKRGAFNEINVTPLVDVMLVLLIIFMVVAPQLEQGVPVQLPEVTTGALPGESKEIVISINNQREIYINKYLVTLADMEPKIKEILNSRTNKEIYLRADQGVPYGYVVKVMALLRKAGASNVGLVTEPEQIKK